MEAKEMICIICPISCHLSVAKKEDMSNEYIVTGNQCPKGESYGIKELTNPTRVLTTTVRIKNAVFNRLPVRTAQDIPRNKILECMKVLNDIEVEGPVQIGTVIVENILGTGIDVVASRSM